MCVYWVDVCASAYKVLHELFAFVGDRMKQRSTASVISGLGSGPAAKEKLSDVDMPLAACPDQTSKVVLVSRVWANSGLQELQYGRDLPPSAVPFITRKSGVARLIDPCGC